MLLLGLALRDLRRDWVYLFCNVAMLVGVIVPLLLLFGVRNGVYEALIGRLLTDPTVLQIDTRGNHSFTEDDAAEVRAMDGAGFVTLKTRSLFDFINVRPEGGRQVRDALLSPSGGGDPMLPVEALGAGEVALSAGLAKAIDIAPGARVELITQAPERARQLVLVADVVAIVPENVLSGRTVLADIEVLDLVEAFYDQYALPEHGITEGRPLAQRVKDFEGLRAFATSLEAIAPLQEAIEARFGIATTSRSGEVARVLGLGRNLGLALLLTTSVAGLGLASALVASFWTEAARKRYTLANLALLGLTPAGLLLFPVVQAAAMAVLGIAASFSLFALAAQMAEHLFETGLTSSGGLVVITPPQGAAIVLAILGLVVVTSFAAAWRAQRTDPAIVLRGG
ncbi:ABC transporter permease [Devosia sp. Root635]|uniref:ABC transporter permease n=1 Tax=Devosia sp. Root635 TaxID=1736575 RepID=UPI0006F86791|nr:FtsX-like permease family protein [Devosia sp. Root635]KRA53000.1 ABC transporter permease [Devosia sp. Root635]